MMRRRRVVYLNPHRFHSKWRGFRLRDEDMLGDPGSAPKMLLSSSLQRLNDDYSHLYCADS